MDGCLYALTCVVPSYDECNPVVCMYGGFDLYGTVACFVFLPEATLSWLPNRCEGPSWALVQILRGNQASFPGDLGNTIGAYKVFRNVDLEYIPPYINQRSKEQSEFYRPFMIG